jgi:hypothetical protein
MDTALHLPILKRTGAVLVVVGLIDIAAMIYCIANGISYSSSIGIFAVIAGFFLLRGSLRAASIVRWFAVFMLAGFLALVVAWPFMQPIGLTLTQVRLNSDFAIVVAALMALLLVLLFWVSRELGRAPLQAARAAAGRKVRDMRVPAAIGVALVVLMGAFLWMLLGGETAGRARSVAEQQLGPGYRYHVSSLKISKSSKGTVVVGVVTAWNEKEIRHVPVRWDER